jgi:hypothetical protein
MTKRYEVNNEIVLAFTVRNEDNDLDDPTTVTCVVREPDGVETAQDVTNTAVGRYRAYFTPTKAGTHKARWRGVGAIKVQQTRSFVAEASSVASP